MEMWGKVPRLKHRELSPTVRFALPVMIENALTMVTTQIAAMLIGRISSASLAATGTGNIMLSFTSAAFAMINTGTAVLVSRLVGAREERQAGDMVEQAISLLLILSAAAALLFFAAARPVMRLLMPGAEAMLMDEAVIFFRISAVSFPFLMLQTLLSGAMRASGNSRACMFLTVSMNALMALLVWLFVIACGMGIEGAGLAYALARAAGAAAAAAIMARYHGRFVVTLRGVLRPRREAYRHIMRVGLPMSLEQVSVQGGYVVGNSLAVGLGTLSATIYQVCSNLNNIIWMPNAVCAATSQAMAGIRLGEGDEAEAKRVVRRVWWAGAAAVMSISLLIALFARVAAGFYSADEAVVTASVPVLWLSVFMSVPAMSINTMDPALRAGGDARFVMVVSIVGVWLIRLPLTWLLAYRFGLGVMGVFLANFTNLVFRMAMGLMRFASGKWIHRTM